MSDIADRAEVLEALARDQGIARARAAVAGAGRDDCADCGEPIEPTRREVMPAATRCSCCQYDFEHAARVQLSGGGGCYFDPSLFRRPTSSNGDHR